MAILQRYKRSTKPITKCDDLQVKMPIIHWEDLKIRNTCNAVRRFKKKLPIKHWQDSEERNTFYTVLRLRYKMPIIVRADLVIWNAY